MTWRPRWPSRRCGHGGRRGTGTRRRRAIGSGSRWWAGTRRASTYLATILAPTYEDPEWQVGDSPYARWRTDIRVDHRIDPPLLRVELRAAAELSSFWPFRGFQGSTVPMPPDIASALGERAAPRLAGL